MRQLPVILALATMTAATLTCAPSVSADAPLRRLALVAGVNRATSDRVALRYAVTDAERFAAVVTHLGGVTPADCVVLREPSRQAFLAGVEALKARATDARATAGRVEVILYYSGHADEQGLLLGHDLVTYRELREALGRFSADVAITVLDACASGAITRLKGGQQHPAFLTDVSSQTSGYAFLTSSSENEAAQESERIGGSYFTHALVSGLRGAADASGDGKVTLGEAYQFAFQETLAQTAPTEAGAQHPAYDMKMSGTGDVVMTDVRQMSSSLVLGPELDGRLFVRNARRQLVAELYKPAGRSIELGLEPGEYQIHFDQSSAFLTSKITLIEGQRRVVARQDLTPARRFATRRRGDGIVEVPRRHAAPGLDGRTRIEWRFGLAGNASVHDDSFANQKVDVKGGQGAFSVVHWLREDLALELAMRGTDFEVRTRNTPLNQDSDTSGLFGVLLGARYYINGVRKESPLRPFVSAGIGPHSDVRVTTVTRLAGAHVDTSDVSKGNAKLGAYVGAGADFILARRFVLGASTGATFVSGHKTNLGVGFTMGFQFGRRRLSD
jgi:hypothetical protein